MSMEDNRRKVNFTDEVFVSTELVEESLRNDFWRDASRPFYETLPVVGGESRRLEGTIRSREVAGLTFASVSFNAQRYNRDRRIIAWSGLDQYLIAVVTGGKISGDFAHTNVSAQCGDICVLDLTQVLQCDVTEGGTLSALIPRRILAKATNYANLHGLVLKAHMPMTKLLTTYLEGLNCLEEFLSDDEIVAVQEALVIILAAVLRGVSPPDSGDLQFLSIVLRQRALDFIDHNIDKPNLSPDLILRRFKVSRAHLYRAFAKDGGISCVIRNRRLDAAFLDLTRTDTAVRSIEKIAFAHGFSNATHFSRCFRVRFGLTPNEARHDRLSGQLAPELRAHLLRFGSKLRVHETAGLLE